MREELFTGRSSSSTSRASGITVAPTATRRRSARGCTGRWARRSGRPDSPGRERTREDRGDGILVLLPPEVHKSLLVELLPSALVASLTAHNRAHRDEERIRLRMSLHAGEVLYDPYGVTGEAINWAFRLVDAEPLKTALARSPGVLAIIASSWFFDQVIRHAAPDVPPVYRQVLVRAKDDTQPGWICLPDHRRVLVSTKEPQAAGWLRVPDPDAARADASQDDDLLFQEIGPVTRYLFSGEFKRLREVCFDPALLARDLDLARFTGREWLIKRIDAFIAVGRAGT